MFFQNVLLNKLNIIIVFQHFFKIFINAYKRYSLNESFFVDNRNKTSIILKRLIIIIINRDERFFKRRKIDSSLL